MALFLQNALLAPVVGQNVIQATADAVVPLHVRQYSATQTGHLTQWEDASGTVLSQLRRDGCSMTLGPGTQATDAFLRVNAPTAMSSYVALAKVSLDKWWLYLPASDSRLLLYDIVNTRSQLALTPDVAGNAFITILDSLRIQAGVGQTAGQLVFYASDGTTIQVSLIGDAVNTLALRNSTVSQALRVYNTFTDASNYERIALYWTSNTATLETQQAGTGTARDWQLGTYGSANVYFYTNNTNRWQITAASGHFLAFTDNVQDIGASGATRPRTGYFGTSLVAPDVRATTTLTMSEAANIVVGTSTGTKIGTSTSQKFGFYNAAPVVQQISGANLTNNVASGGTNDQIDNFTSLAVYSSDAAAIRNNIFQLARKLKICHDALRVYGLLS